MARSPVNGAKTGYAIPGATANALSLANVSAANAAAYDVVVTDATGTLTSFPARLSVVPAGTPTNPGHLIKLSILTSVTAADPLFTLGTVLGGAGTSGAKPLLVRAAGPSLSRSGSAARWLIRSSKCFQGRPSSPPTIIGAARRR